MTYKISTDERTNGVFSPDKLAAIVSDIQTVGFAVVEGLISKETCDLLAAAVVEDAEKIKATGVTTPHEKFTGEGHLQLGLRRYAPFVRTDVVANPLIECVVADTLGAGAWLGFYNGNVNNPGSTYQPLHFDRPFSWKTPEDAARDGQNWPAPTTSLSCSIAVEEITEENGATEIYPGTHRETEVTLWQPGERLSNHPDLLEKWGPPARMPIPAGGICFRDPRMWHRGVPNPADRPRAMIAATFHAARCLHWRGALVRDLDPEVLEKFSENPALRIMDDGSLGDGRLVFQSDVRDIIEQSENPHDINRNSRFVDLPERVNHFLDPQGLGGARVVTDHELKAVDV